MTEVILSLVVTLLGYQLARKIHPHIPRFQPLLLASCVVGLLWWLIDGNWQVYQTGGSWVAYGLGPATVAFAIPLVKQIKQMLKAWKGILLGVSAGSLASIIATWLTVALFHGEQMLLKSMLSKSVTTPFTVELAASIGGIPSLAGVFTVITGMVGSLYASRFLRIIGVNNDWAIGIAVGTSSHAIGLAGLMRESEQQAAAASIAMILAGIVTSIYFIPLHYYFR